MGQFAFVLLEGPFDIVGRHAFGAAFRLELLELGITVVARNPIINEVIDRDQPASPWERDPLETEAQRAERDALIATAGAQSPAEEYIVMRAATRRVLGLPDINIVE